jgi:hypothetical protein
MLGWRFCTVWVGYLRESLLDGVYVCPALDEQVSDVAISPVEALRTQRRYRELNQRCATGDGVSFCMLLAGMRWWFVQ